MASETVQAERGVSFQGEGRGGGGEGGGEEGEERRGRGEGREGRGGEWRGGEGRGGRGGEGRGGEGRGGEGGMTVKALPHDFVNDIVNDRALDAIFATLKAIVDGDKSTISSTISLRVAGPLYIF